MNTAISNPYNMERAPAVRTEINYLTGKKPVRCQSCKRTAKPLVIDTEFLSRPLTVCCSCRSVIQEVEGE